MPLIGPLSTVFIVAVVAVALVVCSSANSKSNVIFFSLAAGPHPRRDLSLTRRLGFSGPRQRVAAGAFFTGGGAPPPPRPFADTSPRIFRSSATCGRRRFFYWRRGPTGTPTRVPRWG